MGTVWDEAIDNAPEPVVEEQVDTSPISTDQYGLIYVGYLTESFDLFGHKFLIRTLKVGEELEAELLTQKYKDTQEADRAYAIALVAACIQTIDNRPLVQGLGPSDETLSHRFQYIMENWHWVTISEVYNRYRELSTRALEALEDVKKKLENNHEVLSTLAYLYEKQGRFTGDLNAVQSNILNWLMIDKEKHEMEMKRQDYEVMALANNERTNVELIKQLHQSDEIDEEEVEWVTPQSEEDVQNILAQLAELDD